MFRRDGRWRGRVAGIDGDLHDALRRADLHVVDGRAGRRDGPQRRERLQQDGEEREEGGAAAHAAL